MPKMGFEMLLTEVEKGFAWPGTQMQRYIVPSEDLKKYGLQRKKGVEQSHYSIWMLAFGETGQALTYVYGHRLLDAAKKAYEMRYPAAAQAEVPNGS